eukprot:m.208449 g.208449  ORF g.208449 m.208449 type:complete len:79 (-) comp13765_c0_seq1:36-272(-)
MPFIRCQQCIQLSNTHTGGVKYYVVGRISTFLVLMQITQVLVCLHHLHILFVIQKMVQRTFNNISDQKYKITMFFKKD